MESISLPLDVLRAICSQFCSVRSILKLQLVSPSLKYQLDIWSYVTTLSFVEEFDKINDASLEAILSTIDSNRQKIEKIDLSFCVLLTDKSLEIVANLFGSTLKSINLSYLELIGVPGLTKLLSSCQRLETFYFEQLKCRTYKLQPGEIWQIVSDHAAQSLKDLDIPAHKRSILDLNVSRTDPAVHLLEARPALEASPCVLIYAYNGFYTSGTRKYDAARLASLLAECYSEDHPLHHFWQCLGQDFEVKLLKVMERFPDFEQGWRTLQNLLLGRARVDGDQELRKRIDDGILRCLESRMQRWLTRDLVRLPFHLGYLEGIFEHHNEAIHRCLQSRDYPAALKLVQEEQQALNMASKYRYPEQSYAAQDAFQNVTTNGNTDLSHNRSLFSRQLWVEVMWAADPTATIAKEFLIKELNSIRAHRSRDSDEKVSDTEIGIIKLLWIIAVHMKHAEDSEKWFGELRASRIDDLGEHQKVKAWIESAPGCASKLDTRLNAPFWDVEPIGTLGSLRVCSYCMTNCYAESRKHFSGYFGSSYMVRLCSCDKCSRRAKIMWSPDDPPSKPSDRNIPTPQF